MKKQIMVGLLVAAALLGLVGVAAAVGDQHGTAVTHQVAVKMDCTGACG